MSVVKAVESDLKLIGKGFEQTALGATALALAEELDSDSSATSKSMCAKALVDVLRELRILAPPKVEDDELSRIRRDREKRRERFPTAKNSARS